MHAVSMIALLAVALAGPFAEGLSVTVEVLDPEPIQLGELATITVRSAGLLGRLPWVTGCAGTWEVVRTPSGEPAPAARAVPERTRTAERDGDAAVEVVELWRDVRFTAVGTYTVEVHRCAFDDHLVLYVPLRVVEPDVAEVIAGVPPTATVPEVQRIALPAFVPALEALAWEATGTEDGRSTTDPRAFLALALCPDLEATRALVRLLDHPDPAARHVVAGALFVRHPEAPPIGPRGRGAWDDDTRALFDAWARQAARDGDPLVDAAALWRLAEVPDVPVAPPHGAQAVAPALARLDAAWNGPRDELPKASWGILRGTFEAGARDLEPTSDAGALIRLAARRTERLDAADEALLADLLGRPEEERVRLALVVTPNARHDGLVDDVTAVAARAVGPKMCTMAAKVLDRWHAPMPEGAVCAASVAGVGVEARGPESGRGVGVAGEQGRVVDVGDL